MFIPDQDIELTEMKEKVHLYMAQNMPLEIADKLNTNTKVDPDLQDGVCVLVCRIADITRVMKNYSVNGVLNVLNTFYTGIDQLLLGKDIYKLSMCGGESTFLLGLMRKSSKESALKVITNAALVAIQFHKYAGKFSKENHTVENTNIRLQIGLDSGSVILGFMGSLVPRYSAFGTVIETASELARNAEVEEIRISEYVHSCLKDLETVMTKVCVRQGVSI